MAAGALRGLLLWDACMLMCCSLPGSSPCWRRRSTVRTLQSGRLISQCQLQRVPNWCLAQVFQEAAPQFGGCGIKGQGVAEQWQWLGCHGVTRHFPAVMGTVGLLQLQSAPLPCPPLLSSARSSAAAAQLPAWMPAPQSPCQVRSHEPRPESWNCPWSLPALDVPLCSHPRREAEVA